MIPFVDLKAQHVAIRPEIDAAIARVIDSCHFTLGPEVTAFESEFAMYCQSENGVAVNSGTSALHLAMLAADIGPGDEVITVPFTFVATVSAIVYAGAKPVFVDIDPHTFTMDTTQIEAAITDRTRAIMPVHLYGHPADMDPILAIAKAHGLIVIEDAAQAHGAEYRGRRAGGIGDMGCFSFYPGKNLGACGESGMIVTDNSAYLRKLRMLRDWGAEKKYEHVLKGYNYRMEAIQGAILRVKLRYLDQWTDGRRRAAARYDTLLNAVAISTPIEAEYARHVYHVYAIRTKARMAWQAALQEQGVSTGIHYPTPVHLLPAFADLGYPAGSFPHAETAAKEVLSLPMFGELTAEQCETVAEAINSLESNEGLAAIPA